VKKVRPTGSPKISGIDSISKAPVKLSTAL
jgi:hypothetical protein